MNDFEILLHLICSAKYEDPETAPFSHFLTAYLLDHGVSVKEVRL